MKKYKFTTRAAGAAVLFGLIFALAFYLRQFTFWLPHWQGDQSQYVILAMKIGTQRSLEGYNMLETNTESIRPNDPKGTIIVYPYRVKGRVGEIIESYRRNGLNYYDMPLFYKAPLFPITLALSHKLLAGPGDPYAVLQSNLASDVLRIRPQIYLSAQLWAAIVPFTASLLILILTYLWTRRRFGGQAALYAAFILAVNPVSILTANRLWTEDLMTLLLTAAMLLYYRGHGRRQVASCFAAGILMGLAALTNQKALLAAAGAGVYTFFAARADRRRTLSFLTDLCWWVFVSGIFLVTFWWFWMVWKVYGNPIWEPKYLTTLDFGWYRVLLTRPHGVIFYTVGTAAICWGFLAGYATIVRAVRSAASAWNGRWNSDADRTILFVWCWILPYVLYYLPRRVGEYRYLMPVYPVLAAVSGYMLHEALKKIRPIFVHPHYGTAVMWIFMAASAVYSVRAVSISLWLERNLIHAPWK